MKNLIVKNEIDDIVVWYRDLPNDYLGINDLIFNRQQLVGYQVEFATEVGLARSIWSISKAIYEKKKMQMRVRHQSDGTTKAENISRANSIKEYEDQQKAEAEYYKLFYALKSHEEVLSAMNQQIAILRAELSRINFMK